MRYTSTLIAVSDIEKSKEFYHDVLGLDVIADFGANNNKTEGNLKYYLQLYYWNSYYYILIIEYIFLFLNYTSILHLLNCMYTSKSA